MHQNDGRMCQSVGEGSGYKHIYSNKISTYTYIRKNTICVYMYISLSVYVCVFLHWLGDTSCIQNTQYTKRTWTGCCWCISNINHGQVCSLVLEGYMHVRVCVYGKSVRCNLYECMYVCVCIHRESLGERAWS